MDKANIGVDISSNSSTMSSWSKVLNECGQSPRAASLCSTGLGLCSRITKSSMLTWRRQWPVTKLPNQEPTMMTLMAKYTSAEGWLSVVRKDGLS